MAVAASGHIYCGFAVTSVKRPAIAECDGRPMAKKPLKKHAQQDGRQRVQQDIVQMVPAACEAEELAVEHVRNPGHREPVGSVARGQRPFQSLRGQSLADVHVAGGVIRIVVVDEVEVANLRVDRKSRQEQRQINEQIEMRTGEGRSILQWCTRLGFGLGHEKIILPIREG